MNKAILFLLAITLLAACKEKSKLEAEVIAIHDEVMPKMGELHVAKKNLKKILQESEDETIKTEILDMMFNLEKADEGMMDWMHQWKVPKEKSKVREYLMKEKSKILKVKQDMLSSIEIANAYLSKSNQQ